MFGYDKDSASAFEAISWAQTICFAPMLFKSAVLLKRLGVLAALKEERATGLTRAELASKLKLSSYALGVAIGAFFIILLRTLKLKTILLILIVVHIAGNVLTAFAPTFETMLASRFIAGLPHGAYFGVGSIIAQRLAAKGKGTSAVSIMIAGMTVSNIFGVPLGTALAHSLSWRTIFYIVVLWGVLVLVSVMMWVRDVGKIKDTGFKGQFVFLKDPAPWLVLAATMLGNAGIFCMHSYISPILRRQNRCAAQGYNPIRQKFGML